MTTSPADVLRPSPLDLGGVIGGTFKVLKQRVGQFAVLALIPSAIMFVLFSVAMVPLVMGIISWVTQVQFSWLVVLGVVLMFAAAVIGYLAQIKIQAMITLGAFDVIHGRPSSTAELSRRSAGVVSRVVLLVLLGIAAVFVVNGLIAGIGLAVTFGAFASIGAGSSSDLGAAFGLIAGALVIVMLLFAAMGFLIYYLMVRFLYFLPALAVENLPAVDSLKRSWGLTKGNVLRTFGYYIVATLLVSLASYMVSLIGQLMWLPALSTPASSYGYDPAAQMLAILPGIIVTALLSFALQVLALPFLTCYITVMYADQVRRNQLPAGFRAQPQPPQHPPAPVAGYQPAPPPYGAAPGEWRPVNPSPQQWGQPPHQWGQPPETGRH